VKIPESNAVKARMLQYVFVGDEVFTLREDFMNPYNAQQLTKKKKNLQLPTLPCPKNN